MAGTGTSDSILARLSAGEFVVNAAPAAKHCTLLEQIKTCSIRLPAFAEGGLVGGGRGGPTGTAAAPDNIAIAPSITVNAAGGTREQNTDLAQQTAKAAEGMIRSIIVSELMSQRRPGNILAGQAGLAIEAAAFAAFEDRAIYKALNFKRQGVIRKL